MPIITQCPKCNRKLRAPDEQVGKTAKCPQCKNPFVIQPIEKGGSASATDVKKKPTAPRPQDSVPEQSAIPAPTAKPQTQAAPAAKASGPDAWFVQLADGAEYGPVTRAEMDAWFAEERIDADCQLLQEGSSQWQWAEDVYPSLASGNAAASPFAGIGSSEAATASHSSASDVSSDRNPYASPTTTSSGAPETPGEGTVTDRMALAMQGTRPWIFFLAILGFIGTGLFVIGMALSCLAMLASFFQGLVSFVFYGVYAGMTGYISYLLLAYAKACEAVGQSRQMADLEVALETQRRYWKTVGIVAIVAVVLTLLFMALIMLLFAGVAAAMSTDGRL